VRPVRTIAEKIRLVQAYDAFPTGSPERGALLRREGLYTSHMTRWRKLAAAADTPAAPQNRALAADNDRLRRQLAQVQARLTQAETIIDIQKKMAFLLGALPTSSSAP
jgi:hypothetical protein